MKNETLGERVRRLRKESGMTQEQLAIKSGIAIGTIQKMERGDSKTNYFRIIRALAKGLGVPIATLTLVEAQSGKKLNEETLGDEIARRRKEMGLSPKEIAIMTGVSESTIRKAEKGIRVREDLLEVIASALGITLEKPVKDKVDTNSVAWKEKTLGERVKSLREELEMTGKQLGEMAGLGKNEVNIIENDKRKRGPQAETLKCIANVFGVSLEILVPEMTPNEET